MKLKKKKSATTKGKHSTQHQNQYNTLLKELKGQKYTILKHLLTKGGITSMEAFGAYGITRLSAVVYELRHDYKVDIKNMDIVDNGICYTRYYMEEGVNETV